jgi:4,5-epoxidase
MRSSRNFPTCPSLSIAESSSDNSGLSSSSRSAALGLESALPRHGAFVRIVPEARSQRVSRVADRVIVVALQSATVLIVGAGPTGLTLACDLRGRGIDALVIDKAGGPATTSRALGLHARGREILSRLGALGDLPDRAVHAYATNIRLRQRLLTKFVVQTERGPEALGPLLISQAEIEAQLRRRLAELGGEVRWDHEIIAATQDGEAVEARLRPSNGERSIRAGWLVGCDGAHSAVRGLMGVQFEGRPFPETWILADVQLTEPHSGADEGTIWLHPDGMIGMVPLPGGVWRIFAELDRDDALAKAGHVAATALPGAAPVSEPVLDRLRSLLRGRIGDASPVIASGIWTSVFRFHRRIASAYRRRRVFLAGDAAHIHSALGGQGMNTGIGDAFNLGWKLACVIRDGASDRLLDTYEGERRPVAADVVRQTSRTWNILLGHSVFNRLLRDHLLLPILRSRAMQRRWVDTGSQLRVSYRGGPLPKVTIGDRLWSVIRRAPVAGDRAPNAACRIAPRNEATTVGALMDTHWTMLLFGGSAAKRRAYVAAAQRYLQHGLRIIRVTGGSENGFADPLGTELVVRDDDGAMASAYLSGPHTAILLRPDGHIAWRSSRFAPDRLAAWLRRSLYADEAPRPTYQGGASPPAVGIPGGAAPKGALYPCANIGAILRQSTCVSGMP